MTFCWSNTSKQWQILVRFSQLAICLRVLVLCWWLWPKAAWGRKWFHSEKLRQEFKAGTWREEELCLPACMHASSWFTRTTFLYTQGPPIHSTNHNRPAPTTVPNQENASPSLPTAPSDGGGFHNWGFLFSYKPSLCQVAKKLIRTSSTIVGVDGRISVSKLRKLKSSFL